MQVIHWASPRFGAAARSWAEPRAHAGGALARMGTGRRDLLAPGGWRRLHAGGPPFTLSDYRVFVTACLAGGTARSASPGPAAETALGAFRRALEGTLASAGASTRRLEPDALLSLAAELTNPDIGGYRDGGTERPPRRWAPRDPLHEQCTAPGRALTVHPTGLMAVTVGSDSTVFLDGVPVGRAKTHALDGRPLDAIAPGVIPAGHYFLHADHADSHDSRYAEIGLVSGARILGRAVAMPDIPWLGLNGPLVGPEDAGGVEAPEAPR